MAMKQEKQDRRSRRTRQLVTKAMAELLQKKRYEDITVRDIIERADIGSSTFYAHYSDKEDVQAALLEQLFKQLLRQSAYEQERQEVVPVRLLFEHIQQTGQQLQRLVHGRSSETYWKVIENTVSQVIEESLVDTSGQQISGRIPSPVVARYLAGTLLMLLKWWLAADMPYSPAEMDEFFQQLALPDRWKSAGNRSKEIPDN